MFLLFNILITDMAVAQLDAASSLLLKRGTGQSEGYNLDSGRYTVREGQTAPAVRPQEPLTPPSEPPSPAIVPQNPQDPQESGHLPLPVDEPKTLNSVPQKAVESKDSKTFKDRMEDIVLGGDTEQLEQYRRHLPESDRRKNILEISLAPVYIYNDSSSNYWFRNYSTSGPALSVETDIWLTAFFAIDISYMTSLSTGLRANPEGTKYVPVNHEWFGGGFKFRRFLSHSEKAPSLTFGVNYEEYQFKVPYGETQRYRFKTSGLKLSLLFDMYKKEQKSWQLGMALYPRHQHTEVQTAASIKSGSDVSTNAIAFSLGQTFTFNRSLHVFWKLSHKVEKNIFEGTASEADPVSGVTPEGVAITNGFTFFGVGFTWGQ